MPDGFEAYARADATALLRLATLLAGSRQDGEDLAQECLARVARAWRRRPPDDPHGYARRTLANLARDQWRHRRRTPTSVPFADRDIGVVIPHLAVDERQAMLTTLAVLPRRQRAVLVLRYYEDLPDNAIAELLGCSTSSVKKHAARGLARLRPIVEVTRTTTWGGHT